MGNNKVSVVTVSCQSEKYIKRVIESVLAQSYRPLEYIVIDGGSTDGTVKILMDYEKEFHHVGIDFVYVSEPDKGIYDAMNKALKYCSGEWVIYLGADDSFTSNEILEKIFIKEYDEEAGVLYGDVVLENNGALYYRKADNIATLQYKMPFCHQAVLTRREILLLYLFDSSYTAFGDMDLCLRMYINAVKFVYVGEYISVFHVGGASFQTRKVLQKEYKLVTGKAHATIGNKIKRSIWLSIIIPAKCNRVMYKVRLMLLDRLEGVKGK